MPREFTRPPQGFEFTFGGVKANERPDSMPPTKYPVAQNVRSYSQNQIRTRPGIVPLFDAGLGRSAVDLRAYTALQTDDLPRILLRDNQDGIWLDNGVQVGTLAGGGASLGATLIPFRPNASPNPWMYVANGNDYQKFSAPVANVVTQANVGIAEPQAAPDAGIFSYTVAPFSPGTWTPGGTAGAIVTGNRVNDTITVRVNDPNVLLKLRSFQVPTTSTYQIGMNVIMTFGGGGSVETTILDVFSANATAIGISGIYYFAGTTGHCVIVASYLGGGPGIGDLPIGSQLTLTSLRRGALLKIGSEVLYVWSATPGPDGSVAIETSTVGAYTTANTFTILPAIQTIVAGNVTNISDATFQSGITAGIATLTATPGANPFVQGALPFREDDYITIGIKTEDLTKVNEIKFLIDVGDASFTQNYYYYTIRPSDIAAALSNAITQVSAVQTIDQLEIIDAEAATIASGALKSTSGAQTAPGALQWSQITFPISALTRVGSDQTKSLQSIVKIQLLVNASGSLTVVFDAPTVVGGFAPDVGDIGSPYYYRIRPRSSVTGVVGNPSPATRYGVSARRQSVFVPLPSTFTDPQMDTWDVFRLGGTVTEWRQVGTANLNTTVLSWGVGFLDIYDDDAARAGDALDFDNFEPWPSIDLPNNGALVSLVGWTAVVTSASTSILRYLPGTLVVINGQNAYTLQTRPTLVSGSNYLLQFVENAGIVTGNISISTFQIQEPILARQTLPFIWGPDVNGTVFACGDSLRPGTLYFAKGNAPDAAPDSYNIEITPPTEPLQGGEVLDGLSFVASTQRWWALYPQPNNPTQRYNFVQQPLTRGLAAPFGHCNDGVSIFWWARDGIYSSTEGSLTDADLLTIFPHEGVAGTPVAYNGVTILPPDYAQAPKFRLAYANGYLYATYPYIGGNGLYAPMLVCNLRTKAWSTDLYSNMYYMTNVYQLEQTAESVGVRNPVVLLAGPQLTIGNPTRVLVQTDLANDNGSPIFCTVATFEFDGGDKRAPKQWGDVFVDCRPAAAPGGITVTPMSLGASVAVPTTIPTNAARVRVPISVGGIVVSDFLGAFFQWTDDFTRQTAATHLYLWQPSLAVQPAFDLSWTSFGSAFGGKGYQHVRQLTLAYLSNAPITITTQTFDGQDPAPIVVPSSGGAYQKITFPFSANKGLLFSFTASSPLSFQIFNDDSELYVGEWGRQDDYRVFRGFGGRTADDAPI